MNDPETLKLMEKLSKLTDEEKKNMLKFDNFEETKTCHHCGGLGYDPYPNHDTTMRPCPECAKP